MKLLSEIKYYKVVNHVQLPRKQNMKLIKLELIDVVESLLIFI